MTAADTPGAIGRTPRQVAGPEVDRLRESDALDDEPDTERTAPAVGRGDDAVDDRGVDGPEPDGTEALDPDPDVEPTPTAPEFDPDPDAEVESEPVAREPQLDPDPVAEFEPATEPVAATDLDPEVTPAGFMIEPDELRRRWEAVQASFVDDPRGAVEQADGMVSAAVAALQARIEQRREDLAETWRDGEQVSTDTLLRTFQRYRDLFDGVLST